MKLIKLWYNLKGNLEIKNADILTVFGLAIIFLFRIFFTESEHIL